MNLTDKNIVVTGAGGGLGEAYAKEIAARGGGVVVNDLGAENVARVVADIERAGGRAIPHVGSVADWDEAGALVRRCCDELGGIFGLVNNAGTTYLREPWAMEEAPLRTLVDVNLLGAMFCGVQAMTAMIAQGAGGVILNATSGSFIGILDHSAYGATKAALTALTYGWALDLQPHGIRVNAISPLARTPMSAVWDKRDAAHMDEPEPAAIAPLVAYLMSDHAERISGQVVRLDAHGLSLLQRPGFTPPIPLPVRDVDSIASAFDAHLFAQLPPVGFTPITLDR